MEPIIQNDNIGIMGENLMNCEPIVQNGIFEHFTDDEKMFLRTEKSKPLKFLFLKFKCIIVFSVLIIKAFFFSKTVFYTPLFTKHCSTDLPVISGTFYIDFL